MNCKNCGNELSQGQVFCPACGEKVTIDEDSQRQNTSAAGSFAQSLKNDIGNSESINMVKAKVNSMDKTKVKKYGIIAIVAVALIVIISVFANFHTCDRCGKHFFGKQFVVSGEYNNYKCCRSCYWEYYE